LQTVNAINCLEKKGQPNEELENKLKALSLKLEIEEPDIDCDVEFAYCVKELRSLAIKQKLNNICREIKIAEQEKDEQKIKELVDQFCYYSKSRNNLESQTS